MTGDNRSYKSWLGLVSLRILVKKWSHPPESNRRPTDYESVALPTELGWPEVRIIRLLIITYISKEDYATTSLMLVRNEKEGDLGVLKE